MIKNAFVALVVAASLVSVAPAAAQDFSYENCDCVDGILYCSQQTESYESVQDYPTAQYSPQETYETSYRAASYASAAGPPDTVPIVLLAVIVLALIIVLGMAAEAISGTPDPLAEADAALLEAAEAAEAQANLEAAAREADEVIKRQAARAFARGRNSS